jgi:formylglycine-generating enzyme required for sulfatase activity
MVWISGGTFRMGSDRHYAEEAPVHRVAVDGFWIDRTPVTNRQFRNFVLDAANGQRLWGQNLGGAIGGGVITYTANGAQKVAVASGFTMIAWPTKIGTAKIVVLGLE